VAAETSISRQISVSGLLIGNVGGTVFALIGEVALAFAAEI
jgi:hypothetical protein